MSHNDKACKAKKLVTETTLGGNTVTRCENCGYIEYVDNSNARCLTDDAPTYRPFRDESSNNSGQYLTDDIPTHRNNS